MLYSVLVCTYNGEEYIAEQIASILSQSILPLKIIVSDDGSKDRTTKIVKQVCAKYSYSNVEFRLGCNQGVKGNFLNNLYDFNGDYLFLSDQDDVWKNDKIAEYSEVIKNNQVDLIYSDSEIVNHDLTKCYGTLMSSIRFGNKMIFDDSILLSNCVQGATICMSRDLIQYINQVTFNFGIFNIVIHDWWIAIVAKYGGFKVFYIGIPLIMYRQHKNNVVGGLKSDHIKFFNKINLFYKEINQFYHLIKFFKIKHRLKVRYINLVKKMCVFFWNYLFFSIVRF